MYYIKAISILSSLILEELSDYRLIPVLERSGYISSCIIALTSSCLDVRCQRGYLAMLISFNTLIPPRK